MKIFLRSSKRKLGIKLSSVDESKIKSLFNLKDKNIHRSHVVYKGDCSCGNNYIGETVRNVEVQIHEHSNPCNDAEPARHLRENPSHSFC